MTDDQIDSLLEPILRAAGTSLRHYSMQKSKDEMRAVMRTALAQRTEPAAPVAEVLKLSLQLASFVIEHPYAASGMGEKLHAEWGEQRALAKAVWSRLAAHPQASTAAVPEGADPAFYVRDADVAALESKLIAGRGAMLHKKGGEGKTAYFAHPPRESGDAEARREALEEAAQVIERIGPKEGALVLVTKGFADAIRSAYQGKEA